MADRHGAARAPTLPTDRAGRPARHRGYSGHRRSRRRRARPRVISSHYRSLRRHARTMRGNQPASAPGVIFSFGGVIFAGADPVAFVFIFAGSRYLSSADFSSIWPSFKIDMLVGSAPCAAANPRPSVKMLKRRNPPSGCRMISSGPPVPAIRSVVQTRANEAAPASAHSILPASSDCRSASSKAPLPSPPLQAASVSKTVKPTICLNIGIDMAFVLGSWMGDRALISRADILCIAP